MKALRFSSWTTLLLLTHGALGSGATTPTTITWTGADPSGYWSAPANWSPAGVPVSGAELVFPGGLPPDDMVSTNDLTDSIFRSIRFGQASRHTIRGNPITLTNRSECIINSGTNVIACDLTFSGTPPTPTYGVVSIRGDLGQGSLVSELTLIGNVGGGSLYASLERLVIRGQFTGGTLRLWGGTLSFYGDDPSAGSAEIQNSVTLLVHGSRPNLNITMFWEFETAACPFLRGDGVVGDVTGCGHLTLDSTLSVKNISRGVCGTCYYNTLTIRLNGTNVGEYGRLVASGDVSLSSGRLLPSAGFNPQPGQIYTIVEKTSPGPIANAFLGPEGTVTNLNGMPFRISYVGGDGNDVTLTAQSTNADPTFSDANWSSLGGIDGGSGSPDVRAAVVDGSGNLYIGGFFTISGVFATNIAKWNGSHWSALGASSDMTNLYALAVSGSDLYAAGRYWTAGGTLVNRVAKWDGNSWSALGSGVGGYAYALAVSGSNLYVGGDFPTAGGTPANRIAKWDGSSWSALGSGINGGHVSVLAVSGSNLYAGGTFTTAGGVPALRIAKWDGSSWSPLGEGIGHNYVWALAVSGSNLYAGGNFTTAGGSPANRIAKWNGSSWSALGSGLGADVWALAVSGSDLYAGGPFTTAGGSPANYIAKWNGSSWSPLGSGISGQSYTTVYALAVSGSDLYVGGQFTIAGGKVSRGIAKARIASAAESITAAGSSAAIQFSGVVGSQYHVQRTASLASPITWTTLTTTPLSPAADGSLSFIDTNAPPGAAYYRLVQH